MIQIHLAFFYLGTILADFLLWFLLLKDDCLDKEVLFRFWPEEQEYQNYAVIILVLFWNLF